MATQIVDLELTALPSEVETDPRYDQAYLLLRWRGRPVGNLWLPIVNGRLNHLELEDAINHSGNFQLWKQVAEEYLGQLETTPTTLPKATVAVCTRDRPDDIRRCLEGFMALPDDGQEYLVVDNNPSTNATQKIAAQFGGRVRYVREDRPGLNNARNRALREAKHEIVAFNDDDAVPEADWLRNLLKNFSGPNILCVTGLTVPLELETKAQEWFEQYTPFGRGFERTFFYGSDQTAMKAGHCGAGANMALRRNVLEKVGPFDPALDAGTPTQSGGDTEMFARILHKGYHIVYDPAAVSWHRHRRSWEELRRVIYGYGVGTTAFWTRSLLSERRLGVLTAAWYHLRHYHFALLKDALLRREGHLPFDLLLAELRGSFVGSRAYLKARRAGGQLS